MGRLSRLSKKCRECPFKDKCNKKRMEAEAYLPKPMAASAVMPSVSEMAAPMAVKHDYRDINLGENQIITIGLEELKRQMKHDFYKSVGLVIDYGA